MRRKGAIASGGKTAVVGGMHCIRRPRKERLDGNAMISRGLETRVSRLKRTGQTGLLVTIGRRCCRSKWPGEYGRRVLLMEPHAQGRSCVTKRYRSGHGIACAPRMEIHPSRLHHSRWASASIMRESKHCCCIAAILGQRRVLEPSSCETHEPIISRAHVHSTLA